MRLLTCHDCACHFGYDAVGRSPKYCPSCRMLRWLIDVSRVARNEIRTRRQNTLHACRSCGVRYVGPHRAIYCRPCQTEIARAAAEKRSQSPAYRYKSAARGKVGAAIRAGKLIRQPCEKCGSAVSIHAHHDDYSRPLDVRWLCSGCHARWHAFNEAKLGAAA